MARNISEPLYNALTGPNPELYNAVFLDLEGAPLRLWSGFGERTIGGQTYTGSGSLLQISQISENSELNATGIQLTLSGMNQTLISAALQENYQGRQAQVFLGELSVADVITTFDGLMDVATITHDSDQVIVEMTVESKLITLQRPNVRRYTQANHALRHPNDTFFDFTASLIDKQVAWGRTL